MNKIFIKRKSQDAVLLNFFLKIFKDENTRNNFPENLKIHKHFITKCIHHLQKNNERYQCILDNNLHYRVLRNVQDGTRIQKKKQKKNTGKKDMCL